jgi:hypothetical protein
MSTDLIESAYKHCPGRITMAQITVPTSGPGGESGSVGKKPDYPAEEAKAARRSKCKYKSRWISIVCETNPQQLPI